MNKPEAPPETGAGGLMDKENDRKQMEGELYDALITDETAGEFFKSYDICHEFNSLDPEDEQGRKEILPRLFGSIGAGCRVHPPVRIFRGDLISLSDNVSIGAGTCILATNRVKIGSNTIIGDECSISCAGHPMDKDLRAQGLVGDGAVIGAGSVVTKNIPAGVYADGNPCRVRRKLRTPEEEERLYGAKAAADADLSDPSEVLCLMMDQIALSDYDTRDRVF